MTGVVRHWIGWDTPVLESASSWLVREHADAGTLRMGRTMVVVPAARAGRWLEGMLVDAASDQGAVLEPPRIVPSAHLAEALSAKALASEGARLAAWRSVLAYDEAASDTLGAGADGWAWARCLARTSEALVRAGKRFPDAVRLAQDLEDDERARLDACARLERAFHDRLTRDGQFDTAQVDALRGEWDRVVLVALPELSARDRTLLTAHGARVDALVASPESLADRFDVWGSPVPGAWADADLPLVSDRLRFAHDPEDQSQAVWECVASVEGPLSVRDVVIGGADRASLGAIERAAHEHGVTTREATGAPARLTPVGDLLLRVGALVREPTMATLGALVRHPDVERAIGSSWWLRALDRYAQRTQRERFVLRDDPWTGASDSERKALDLVVPKVRGLLAPLLADETRPLSEACERVCEALSRVYEGRTLSAHAPADLARRQVLERVAAHARSMSSCAEPSTPLGALELLTELVGEEPVAPVRDEDAVEVLGWLELATDPSPVCVVCDANEGVLPSRVGVDPLLPGPLRERLGLPTDEDRAGRDAYLMALLASSRRELFVVSCSRSSEGDPRSVSRLLFRASDAEVLGRMERAVSGVRDPLRVSALARRDDVVRVGDGFASCPTPERDPPDEWPVTRFRTYLDSPYAFYVQTVLRRREVRLSEGEFDGAAFGDLLHDALARFGRDEEARALTDPHEISAALGRHLDDAVKRSHGGTFPVGVEVQIEQALLRLHSFAPVQAAWAEQGWRIRHIEWSPTTDVLLDVPGGADAKLLGRIDRIDVNERDGRVAIIDYKSGKHARKPESTHRVRDGSWRDLQLPLYRRLARELGAGDAPVLAYALLPSSADGCEVQCASWGASDLADAEATARWVVGSVRAGAFGLGDRPYRDGVLGALGGFGLIDAGGEGAA